MAQMADEPLSQLGRRIRGLFTALEATTDHLDLSSLEIIDLAQRFDLWSLNLGLHQDGHESLDYRFRDAPATCRFARFLLAELERNLQLSMCFRIINSYDTAASAIPLGSRGRVPGHVYSKQRFASVSRVSVLIVVSRASIPVDRGVQPRPG